MTESLENMIKENIRKICKFVKLTAAAVAATICMCSAAFAQTTIEYDNLRELLLAGNSTLKYSSLQTSINDLEDEITALESEYGTMKLEYEVYKDDDPDTAAQYKQNAKTINSTLKNLRKSLKRYKKSNSSNEIMIGSMTQTAQTLMCTYKQMELNVTAAKKSYDASVAAYNSTTARYSVGMASETDVTDALNAMLSKQNVLSDYTIRRDSARFSLLSLLGITDSSDVVIGDVPAPNLTAIAAVDQSADEALLISYDNDVQSANHENGANVLKEAEYTEAIGEAYVSADETYDGLKTELLQYQAAQESYEAAQAAYATAQRKKEAGMMTEADFLAQEATYLSAYTTYKTEEMTLSQLYTNYQWSLQGV